MPVDVTIRPCDAADAAALASMYAADGDAILADDPSTAPAFFTVDGQRERITRIWPEHDCRGFVAELGALVVGVFVLEDIADHGATVGYYVASAARNRGVATAALRRLVEVGSGPWG